MVRRAMTLLVGLAMASGAAMAEVAVLKVTADVGITSVQDKMLYSNGQGPAAELMQNQNWSGFENKDLLMAFDARPVQGWTVSKATLHLTVARGDFWGVGLCTVLGDWREGRALNGVEAEGAPCWNFARTPAAGAKPGAENWWAWPGSRFFSVSWSHPAARYSHAGPSQIVKGKTADGRFLTLAVPVEPKLVESLAAGVATGLVLTDDKGQVRESYSLIGPAYPYRYNASLDAWVYTRDIQLEEYRPRLEVVGEATDKTAPAAPKDLKVAEVRPSDGSAVLTFTAPGDDGAAGAVLAYEARTVGDDGWDNGKPLPLWSMPKPVAGGTTQRMPIFTLPAGSHRLAVRGVDEAGNRGPAAEITLTIPNPPAAQLAAAAAPGEGGKGLDAVKADPAMTVAAVGDMVKVDPVTGWILCEGEGYARDAADPTGLWDAGNKTLRLTAAANEVVACQLILGKAEKDLTNVKVSVGGLAGPAGRIAADPNIQAFRMWYVPTVSGRRRAVGPGELDRLVTRASGWHGDACLPLEAPFADSFNIPAADNDIPGQRNQAVWLDLYVPRGTRAGEYQGAVTVTADQLAGPVKLPVRLKVLPIALPDQPTFAIELNRYHDPADFSGVDAGRDPDKFDQARLDFYRLAHQHRATLNALPYSHSGRVNATYIPVMEGTGTDIRIKDWTDFDRRFGPLLDGTAFSAKAGYAGPGQDVPISHLYMAFHEAWPIPVNKDTYADWVDVTDRLQFAEYAKKARRPDVAFSQAYKDAWRRNARQYFEHFAAKGWTHTSLHFYNNNKYYWKVAYFGGQGVGGASFWLMDEPSDFDDYDANGFVMRLALQARAEADAPGVKVNGRVDVSQPDMARGLWDEVATVWCIGGMRGYSPTTAPRRRWLPDERHWAYGGGTGVPQAPATMSGAALTRWAWGCTGWMPWWNCFGAGSGAWKRAEDLAIYYTGSNYAGSNRSYPGAIAGVRLKIARRCQQDVEYLHLLAGRPGWDRDRVRQALRPYADDPDAPLLRFDKLSLDRLNELKSRVVATLLRSS